MQKDSEKSRINWVLGQEILNKYLKGEIQGSDKIRIALQACNQHAKMIASEANHETNRLVAARLVYEDPKEREKYIKATMPKLLEGK